jgi:hypothetical protein
MSRQASPSLSSLTTDRWADVALAFDGEGKATSVEGDSSEVEEWRRKEPRREATRRRWLTYRERRG